MIFIPKFYGQLGLGQRNKNKYDANERKYERKEERRKQRQELKIGKQQPKRRKTEDFKNYDRHISRKLERQQKRKSFLSTNYEVSPNNERQYNRKLKRQQSRKPSSHEKSQYGRVSMVKFQNAPKKIAGLGGSMKIRLVSDPNGDAAKSYGVLKAEENVSFKAIVLIGKD